MAAVFVVNTMHDGLQNKSMPIESQKKEHLESCSSVGTTVVLFSIVLIDSKPNKKKPLQKGINPYVLIRADGGYH